MSTLYNHATLQMPPLSIELLSGDEDRGHPRYVEPPVIPGHEFVGEVVELGKGVAVLCLASWIVSLLL